MRIKRINYIKNLGRFEDVSNSVDFGDSSSIVLGFNGMGKSTLSKMLYSISNPDDVSVLLTKTTLLRDGEAKKEISVSIQTDEDILCFQDNKWNVTPKFFVFNNDYVDNYLFLNVESPKRLVDNSKIVEIGLGAKISKLQREKKHIQDKVLNLYISEILRIVSTNYSDYKVIYAMGNTRNIKEDNIRLLEKLKTKVELFSVSDKTTVEKSILSNSKYDNEINLLRSVQTRFASLYVYSISSYVEPLKIKNLLGSSPMPTSVEIVDFIRKYHKKSNLKWMLQGFYNMKEKNRCPYCGNILDGDSKKAVKAIERFIKTRKNAKANEIIEKLKIEVDIIGQQKIEADLIEYSEILDDLYNYSLLEKSVLDKYLVSNSQIMQINTGIKNLQNKIWMKIEHVFDQEVLEEGEKNAINSIMIIHRYIQKIVILIQKEINKLEKQKINDKELQRKEAIYNISYSENREDFFKIPHLAENVLKAKQRINEIDKEILDENDRFQFERINKKLRDLNIKVLLLKRDGRYYIKLKDYQEQQFSKGNNEIAKDLLSEGESRALAFAFFLVEIEINKDIANKVIVIDDPITSLDLNKKSLVAAKIADLMNIDSYQILVMTHDISFAEKIDFLSGKRAKKLIIGSTSLFDEFKINDYLLSDKQIYEKIIEEAAKQPTYENTILALMAISPLAEVQDIKICKESKFVSTYFKHTIYATDKTNTSKFEKDNYKSERIMNYLIDMGKELNIALTEKIPLNNFSFVGFSYENILELYNGIDFYDIMNIRKKAMVLRVLAEVMLYELNGNTPINYNRIGTEYVALEKKTVGENKKYAKKLLELYNQIKKYQHGAKGISTLGLSSLNPEEIAYFDSEIQDVISYVKLRVEDNTMMLA